MDNWSLAANKLVQKFNVKIIPVKEIYKEKKWVLQPCATFKQTQQEWEAENPTETTRKLFATQDPEIISEWAESYEVYGVVAGNDTLIIDIDVNKGKRGIDALKWLVEHGLPDDVFTVRSPSGGFHKYYYTPAYPALQTGVCVDIEHKDVSEYLTMLNGAQSGIDTRHGHAFCIGPMSVKKSGMYEVVKTGDRGVIPVGLKIGAKKSAIKLKPVEAIVHDKYSRFYTTEEVEDGQRNEFAKDFTCWLAHQNLTQSQVVSELNRLYSLVGKGVNFDEIQSMYDRIIKKIGDDPFQYYINRFYECDYEKLRGWFDAETQEAHSHSYFKQKHNHEKVTIEVEGKLKTINPFDILQSHKSKKVIKTLGYFPGKPATFNDALWGDVGNTCLAWQVDIYHNISIDITVYVDAFKRVFNNLFGHYSKEVKMWFVAALFAPSVRCAWSLYILSKEQGIGKDLVLEVLFSLFGEGNTLIGADIKLFASRFNSLLAEKSMIAFSDFPKIVSTEARNETKSQIKRVTTALRITTEKKGWEAHEMPIFSRYVFTNNDMTAMEIDLKDRRLYVINSRALPLDDDTYTNAGLCHRNDELALSAEHREQCKREIISWLVDTCDSSVDDCVAFVRARPPVTADKLVVQRKSENLRLLKTRQAIQSGLDVHEGYSQPTYRGDSIFYSSVVSEASLRFFLTYEIGQKGTSVERYIDELEDEGIIEKIRYGTPNSKGLPKWVGVLQCPKETFWIDSVDHSVHRSIQGPNRSLKCWAVTDLWAHHHPARSHASWRKADFAQEYKMLFSPVGKGEPMVIDEGREINPIGVSI